MKKWIIAILFSFLVIFGINGTVVNDTIPADGDVSTDIHLNDKTNSPADIIQNALDMELNRQIPANLAIRNHAFIVLGSSLTKYGEPSEKLIHRLEVAVKAANHYPHSTIIVTGGKPKSGITEADAMYKWLVQHGIPSHQIIKETRSTDTVENAVKTFPILQQKGIHHITLITSAHHMRRAFAIFSTESLNYDGLLTTPITQIIYSDDKSDTYPATLIQQAKIYYDVMRVIKK